MTEAKVKLFFLVSQPRSGSTLLQHIIGSRSDVATLPEPWFMLHFAYGLRERGFHTEYNAHFAFLAMNDFLVRIPEGEGVYYRAIASAAGVLYGAAASNAGKQIFLDKTPRYYHIIPELRKTFPESKIILLTRNPIAVFTSILDYNFDGDWAAMLQSEDRRHDLISAPRFISQALVENNQNTAHVRYEELVLNPEVTVHRLCDSLEIAFEPGMLHYGKKIRFYNTTSIDTKSIYRHDRPVDSYVDAWMQSLDSVDKVSIATAYLNVLSDDVLDCYGFGRGQLEAQLRALPGYRRGQAERWAKFLQSGREAHMPFLKKGGGKLVGKIRGTHRRFRSLFGQ